MDEDPLLWLFETFELWVLDPLGANLEPDT